MQCQVVALHAYSELMGEEHWCGNCKGKLGGSTVQKPRRFLLQRFKCQSSNCIAILSASKPVGETRPDEENEVNDSLFENGCKDFTADISPGVHSSSVTRVSTTSVERNVRSIRFIILAAMSPRAYLARSIVIHIRIVMILWGFGKGLHSQSTITSSHPKM
jgi:hypothetical protein